MTTCAIIPARGGSKGVPKKNLQSVGGRSLLARAIDTCHKAKVDRVIVSTEDEQIAGEAARFGASVHKRAAVLAEDDVASWPVLQDAGKELTGTLLWVQCTAPLMTPEDITGCLDKLPDYDVVIACHRTHAVLIDEEGKPVNRHFPLSPRQGFHKQYVVSGSVWAFRREHLGQDYIYTGRVGIHESASPMRLEIDEPGDLEIARRLLG